jgi:CelD/BcsL family acetyltransferase involved in cellulose biosynthesis
MMILDTDTRHLRDTPPQLHVRTVRPSELTPELVRAWADLENRSLHCNAFLSPYFILPAIRHLTSDKNVLILLVENSAQSQLLGVAAFEIQRPAFLKPLPYLTAYRPPHSYLNGLLIDSQDCHRVFSALYDSIAQRTFPYPYIDLHLHPECAHTEEMHRTLAHRYPVRWEKTGSIRRALLRPASAGADYLQTKLKSRYKDCMRLMRQLSKIGTASWHYLAGMDVTENTIERFLELEHKGWKGTEGSSLASNQSHSAFFRDMILGFQAQHRVFFTELRLNGRAIASTCNLISGKAAFGFKVGWDPEYARYSPGILNAFHLILNAPSCCRNMEFIDSCSSPDSFINDLWLEDRTLVTSAYTTSFLGSLSQQAHRQTDRVMNKMNELGDWTRRMTDCVKIHAKITTSSPENLTDVRPDH